MGEERETRMVEGEETILLLLLLSPAAVAAAGAVAAAAAGFEAEEAEFREVKE